MHNFVTYNSFTHKIFNAHKLSHTHALLSHTHTHNSFTPSVFHNLRSPFLFQPLPSHVHSCFVLIGSSWLVRLSGPLIYTTFGMTASLCQVHSLRRWGLGLVAAALAALGLRNQPAKAAIFLDSTCIRCTASAGNRPNSISFLERFQPQVIFDVFFFSDGVMV